jgi:hypothetical protein
MQICMLIARRRRDLRNLGEGRPSETAQIQAVSQSDAATMLNVGRSSVQQARQVQERAAPELQAAVEQRHVAVSVAAKQVSRVG